MESPDTRRSVRKVATVVFAALALGAGRGFCFPIALGQYDSSAAEFASSWQGSVFDLDAITVGQFPKEINGTWWTQEELRFDLSGPQAAKSLEIVWRPAAFDATIGLEVAFWNGSAWAAAGTVNMGAAGASTLVVPSSFLVFGENRMRWRVVSGTGWVVWDQILIRTWEGRAKNNSYATACAEYDNINVPILKSQAKSFRITSSHPSYSDPATIWSLGSDDGSSAEFLSSGFANEDIFYAPDDPAAGTDETVSQMPAEINNDWMNHQYLVFTMDDFEKPLMSELTIDFAGVNGTLEIKAWTWNGSAWTDQGGRVFNASLTKQAWVFPENAFSTGTDKSRVILDVVTDSEGGQSTPGAWGQYDSIRLERASYAMENIWSAGEDNGDYSEFKASGYGQGDEYYPVDKPASGVDEPASEFPREINNDWLNDIYFKFTTEPGLKTQMGAYMVIDFTQVTNTLEIKAEVWNGSGWTDLGRRVFQPSWTRWHWEIPDGVFQQGADGNNIHLHVVTAAEGGVSQPGAYALFDYVRLTRRPVIDGRSADWAGCFQGNVIWALGADDGTSEEFKSSGFGSPDVFYAPDNPVAGTDEPASEFPLEINNDWMRDQYINFTTEPGYETNAGAELVVDFAGVNGTLEIEAQGWNGTGWTSFGTQVVDSAQMQAAWTLTKNMDSIPVNDTEYRDRYDLYVKDGFFQPGPDGNAIRLHVVTAAEGGQSTPGAWGQYDYLRLRNRKFAGNDLWWIGSHNGSNAEFKQSGFGAADEYYPEDIPEVVWSGSNTGTEEPSTEMPKEINHDWMTDQYLKFTTEVGQKTTHGSRLTIGFVQVSGTLELEARTWNGSDWASHGRKVFTSLDLEKTWEFPDGTWPNSSPDGNSIQLHVVKAAEGGSTTSGAWGLYDYLHLRKRDSWYEPSMTIYEDSQVRVLGVYADSWWRKPEDMDVYVDGVRQQISGVDPFTYQPQMYDFHWIALSTRTPGMEWEKHQVLVLYQDGYMRLLPLPQFGQSEAVPNKDWIPFGSSVILGPAAESFRPYASVASVDIHPSSLSMDITFQGGGTAHVAMKPSREQTVVEVTSVTYNTGNTPLTTLRSMWVADGDNDMDHILGDAGRFPVMGGWTELTGESWYFHRLAVSKHVTFSPDIRIEITEPAQGQSMQAGSGSSSSSLTPPSSPAPAPKKAVAVPKKKAVTKNVKKVLSAQPARKK